MTSSPTHGKRRGGAGNRLEARSRRPETSARSTLAGQWIRMSEGGRIVVPAEMREALGVGPGTKLFLEVEDGVLTVRTFDGAATRLQELLAPEFPTRRSLVDELIAERRAEAARE